RITCYQGSLLIIRKLELNREHFRATIYYNFQRQLSQKECLPELLSVFGNEEPLQSTISRWYGEFKRGRVSLSDDSRVGAPKTAVTQENSTVWVFHGEEKPTKVIRSRRVSKKMQITVTADWYTTICLPKVITELRKINPKRRIILHQDNASSHTAQKTRHPDLSPNDFFTFPKIKNRLRSQRFQSPEEAVDAFKNAVLNLPANEWNNCFENWFESIQMCINLRGEYFEKQ
ncbi:unnamed protein product, partial [Acanthoscelides obtectus]